MIVRNTVALGTALVTSCIVPATVFSAALVLPTFGGLFGGAAFTTALCIIGSLVGLPTLIGGLLGLLLLQVVVFLIVYIWMHIQLAWIPV